MVYVQDSGCSMENSDFCDLSEVEIKKIQEEARHLFAWYSIGKVRKIDQKQSGIGKGAVMKKKYVLFDFDGVIADTEESNSHYLGLAL